ncbi:hypothetical protein L5515_014427 [Caenorhabditis briggsae]|uniref:Uncharacterized protein n=1 Tax=Caenorhabditis briggsae TaxID=6238 RepID=A0AAE9DK41_CAEBR|nr:hypothetical protein L3Y34_018302 [Caenorhabditis briggsae]UMM18297.1 hypothetical protein L5515_014427 [Caenorhabditis briggsae]
MNFVLLIFFLFTTKCSSLKIKSEIDVTKYGLTQQEILKSPHYKDKVFNIPMNTESGEELLEHWAVQGFSGVVAAIATRRLSLVEEYQKKDHEKCSSEAETLAEHAKCLIQLEDYAHRNRLIHRKRLFVRKMRRRIDKMETRTTMAPITAEEIKKEKEWVGSFRFRAKREIKVHTRDSYTLKSHKEMSPFGLVTKHLTSAVKLLKHTDKVSKWQDTIERIAKKADVIKEQKKMEDFMQRRLSVFTDAAAKMKQNKKLAKDDSLKEMNDLEEFIDNDQIRDVLRNRKEKITEQDKLLMIPMKMMRDAAKMSLGMTGYNTTDFDRKIVRIISPRIMSVIPQEEEAKNNEIDVLSPSLFALHDDGSGVEKKASLGNLLGSLTNNKDSQDFLDFIVEATGVNEAMERVEKKIGEYRRLKDDAMGRGPEGQPLYFTKENVTEKYPHEAKKIDMFEALDKTYSDEQLKEMNRTGYTIMRHDQMDLIYGKGSVGENEKFLKTAKALSRPQIDRAIMSTIKDLAHEKVKFEARRNDIVLSPITFSNFILDPVSVSQPTILSPVMLCSLILSPAIYGVMIMSPWLMVPVIISPRLLSPVAVNPFLMVPIIISPLAFNPFILCPGSMNPFVLSPLVFTPFILSPQVLTPLILTPFCLGPIILNPLALSPLVLSPFVLSPTILSPQYVTAVVLSPYALSPAWGSDGAMVTVFASPSWLS